MIYKDFQGDRLSALGFGAMRLPTGSDGKIDGAETGRMVDYAMEHGVNYYDTAFSYHGGQSEVALGRALAKYPRKAYHLASKFPGHEIRTVYDARAIFEKQLEKCGVDYFDYYLLHNVYDGSFPTYCDPKWGIVDYLLEQKAAGRIKHLGFSAHGSPELLEKLLDRFGESMEFAQIQLNWLDWELQRGREKYELLTRRGVPVWVMEPVRGGVLARLSPENVEKLRELRPEESAAAWAFRWLQRLPNIGVTLSGMSTMEQLEDNIRTFSEERPLSEEELSLLEQIKKGMTELLPCTACRYCCRECPQGLDIPALLSLYSDCRVSSSFTPSMAVDAMEPEKRPSACIACGNCKRVCPQGIDVPAALADFDARLQKLPHWADVSRARAEKG